MYSAIEFIDNYCTSNRTISINFLQFFLFVCLKMFNKIYVFTQNEDFLCLLNFSNLVRKIVSAFYDENWFFKVMM